MTSLQSHLRTSGIEEPVGAKLYLSSQCRLGVGVEHRLRAGLVYHLTVVDLGVTNGFAMRPGGKTNLDAPRVYPDAAMRCYCHPGLGLQERRATRWDGICTHGAAAAAALAVGYEAGT